MMDKEQKELISYVQRKSMQCVVEYDANSDDDMLGSDGKNIREGRRMEREKRVIGVRRETRVSVPMIRVKGIGDHPCTLLRSTDNEIQREYY